MQYTSFQISQVEYQVQLDRAAEAQRQRNLHNAEKPHKKSIWKRLFRHS